MEIVKIAGPLILAFIMLSLGIGLTLENFKDSRVKNEKDNFIYVEFFSEIFGFVDDVEFYFNKPGVIEFRSASRIGYSDLGVNRNRMESIRSKFNDLSNSKM